MNLNLKMYMNEHIIIYSNQKDSAKRKIFKMH